jgi:hypothetical protein
VSLMCIALIGDTFIALGAHKRLMAVLTGHLVIVQISLGCEYEIKCYDKRF